MNALIKFECPTCHQPMEAEPEFTLINCPGCGAKFYPKPSARYSPQEVAAATALNRKQLADLGTAKREPRLSRLSVREKGENFAVGAAIFLVLGGVSFLIGLIGLVDGGSAGWLVAGAGCVGIAFGLYLIAQLLHIRAALESRPIAPPLDRP